MATRPTGKINVAEIGGALFVLVIAATALIGGVGLPFGSFQKPGAGFLPMLEGGLLACVGLVLLVQALRNAALPPIEWPQGEGRRISIVLTIALIGFVLLLPVLGFMPAAVLFFFAGISSWQKYRWYICLLIAICFAVFLYVLFVTLLQMPLPSGYFDWF